MMGRCTISWNVVDKFCTVLDVMTCVGATIDMLICCLASICVTTVDITHIVLPLRRLFHNKETWFGNLSVCLLVSFLDTTRASSWLTSLTPLLIALWFWGEVDTIFTIYTASPPPRGITCPNYLPLLHTHVTIHQGYRNHLVGLFKVKFISNPS